MRRQALVALTALLWSVAASAQRLAPRLSINARTIRDSRVSVTVGFPQDTLATMPQRANREMPPRWPFVVGGFLVGGVIGHLEFRESFGRGNEFNLLDWPAYVLLCGAGGAGVAYGVWELVALVRRR